MEDQVSNVRKNNVSHFDVIGEQFQKDGRVSAWRVSLVRGKEVLASQESYLWK